MSFIKIDSSLVLIVTGVLWFLGAGHASASINLNNNQHTQHSTISSEKSPISSHEAQSGLRPQASNLDPNNSGDSLDDLMNEKYMELPISGNQLDITANLITQEEVSNKHNSLNSMKPHHGKTRRQMEQQQKVADWWNNLINENKTKRVGGEIKSGAKHPTKAPKSVIYREQPLEQNQLITIRHQLMAIRDKHRLLMFRSVPQLMQLDQKLIDSYKLCFKRKMPLYAGMLYRTRDYVVRMANEIVHERQVLEAIAKQIQKVLRQKAQNSTLVRAYNRQLATIISLPPSDSSGSPSAAITDLEPVSQHKSPPPVTPHDNLAAEIEPTGRLSRLTPSSKTPGVAAPIWDDDAEDEAPGSNDPAASVNQKVSNKGKDSKSEEKMDESGQQEKQVLADLSQYAINNIERTDTTSADDKSRSKFKHFTRKNYNENQRPLGDQIGNKGAGEDHSWTTSTTWKPKQRSYTVNTNEVNLKKELTKAQALIDRVNVSSYEITAVADDIVYLFKLTLESQNPAKNIANSARRLKKMMLKSPVQSFIERQSKLMNMLNSGEMNANNLPQMKPLFDTPNFTSYKDPVDIDLGFDSPAVLDI